VTDDEIVALGQYCANLRTSHQFTTLVDQFEKQIVSHMLSTEPHETKKREGIYASFLGVRDFLGNMDAIVNEAAKILEPQQKAAASEFAPQAEEDFE
jgi:hypothetical protein